MASGYKNQSGGGRSSFQLTVEFRYSIFLAILLIKQVNVFAFSIQAHSSLNFQNAKPSIREKCVVHSPLPVVQLAKNGNLKSHLTFYRQTPVRPVRFIGRLYFGELLFRLRSSEIRSRLRRKFEGEAMSLFRRLRQIA